MASRRLRRRALVPVVLGSAIVLFGCDGSKGNTIQVVEEVEKTSDPFREGEVSVYVREEGFPKKFLLLGEKSHSFQGAERRADQIMRVAEDHDVQAVFLEGIVQGMINEFTVGNLEKSVDEYGRLEEREGLGEIYKTLGFYVGKEGFVFFSDTSQRDYGYSASRQAIRLRENFESSFPIYGVEDGETNELILETLGMASLLFVRQSLAVNDDRIEGKMSDVLGMEASAVVSYLESVMQEYRKKNKDNPYLERAHMFFAEFEGSPDFKELAIDRRNEEFFTYVSETSEMARYERILLNVGRGHLRGISSILEERGYVKSRSDF